jgi:hypothetical protein
MAGAEVTADKGTPCNPLKSCKADGDAETIRCTPSSAGNVPLKVAHDVALAAAEAAYAVKESMLSAYCAQGMALGSSLTDLKDGKNMNNEFSMGAYKSAADAATMGGFQFGKLIVGSLTADERKPYRCAVAGDTIDTVDVTNMPAADLPQLLAPGLLTAHAQRHYGAGNAPAAASPAVKMTATLAAAALAALPRAAELKSTYKAWRDLSDAAVLLFKTMLTFAAAGDANNGFTALAANKACAVAPAAFPAGGAVNVANVATALDAGSVAAGGAFDGVLDAAGAQLTVVPPATVHGADGDTADDRKARLVLHCNTRCVALPGYAYYTDVQCRTPGNCCMGTEMLLTGNFADLPKSTASAASCSFMSGPHAITAGDEDGAAPKTCQARATPASKAW